jgi:hypothetical protein
MMIIPDLDHLNVADKDKLVRTLFVRIRFLKAKITHLSSRTSQSSCKNSESEVRFSVNNRNFGKPPITNGLNKPGQKSLRVAGLNQTCGQNGHNNHTLLKLYHFRYLTPVGLKKLAIGESYSKECNHFFKCAAE